MRPLCALGNRLWQLASWPEYRRFLAGLASLRETQEGLLAQSLRRLAPSEYGRRHGVSAGWDYRTFRRRLPLANYEDLQPYLAYPGGLLTEPVRMWEPTGGSTGGSKWIPWTGGLQAQFRRAVSVWIGALFREHPGLRDGRSYWQLTPQAGVQAPAWLAQDKSGFAGDGEYLGPLGRWLERTVLVCPPRADDAELFWSGTVDRLLATPDLRYLSCWSPAFLTVLQQQFQRRMGRWDPQRWWPRLGLISCWIDGPSSRFRPRMEQMFPGVALQGKGLLSTEAVISLPVGPRYPLAYRSHFFEFLDETGEAYPAWLVEADRDYEVVVTTGGGLVRYRTGDRIRVSGHWGRVPCLRFLGRQGVSDHFGEKLAYGFLDRLLQGFPEFALLGFEDEGYLLFLEGSVPAGRQQQIFESVRDGLRQVYTYRDCLALGQLKPLRLFLIKGDALDQLAGQGARFKAGNFHPGKRWSRHLEGAIRE